MASYAVEEVIKCRKESTFIKVTKEGSLGCIAIDRPKALNAMDADMVEAHHAALKAFSARDDVAAILVEGVPKAFCAGGDIKSIREFALQQPYSSDPPPDHPVARVFQTEYNQVCDVARCPIPYMSFCTGAWMGFGVGNSAHGDVRIVTEKTLFAMPENAIGLFPDVGFAHVATQMPGAIGLYLGLTGKRLKNPEDLLFSGLGTHYVHSERLPSLRAALVSTPFKREREQTLAELGKVLSSFQEPSEGKPELCKVQPLIGTCFLPALHYTAMGKTTVQALDDIVLDLLNVAQGNDAPEVRQFCLEALEAMQGNCPMSMAVTLRHYAAVYQAVHAGKGPLAEIEGVMQQEYALAVRMCGRSDFAEGVRAVVVDKDKNPRWNPDQLSDISEADLDEIFAPMPPGKGLRRDFLDD